MSTVPAFASATQALDMVRAGLRFLAASDATQMSAAERAACLRGLEKADASATAARTSVLGTFGTGQDYVDDGDYSPFSWLVHRTRVTRGAAADHTGWVKRAAAHPAVQAALAAEAISTSYAREICRRTGKLPGDTRAAADEILSPRPRRAWSWKTWPRWPPRCTRSPARPSPMTTARIRSLMTGR